MAYQQYTQQTPPVIIIKSSRAFENTRVFRALQLRDWYIQHGYQIRLPLRLQRQIKQKNVRITKSQISAAINSEYEASEYKKMSQEIQQWWKKTGTAFAKRFYTQEIPMLSHYQLWLTYYGTNGSYEVPNRIILNVNKKTSLQIHGIILHEFIHLGIEPLIIQFRIPHAAKEKLVDCLLRRIAPTIAFTQMLPRTKELRLMEKICKKEKDGSVKLILEKFERVLR